MGAIGAASVAVPLINSMNPSADVLSLSTTEVDLKPIAVGQAITVVWRGKPVFVRRRTPDEIKAAQGVALGELPDPQPDSARVKKPEWLILVGVCTHLGCIPQGQKPTEMRGDFGGWFCPCHGSAYDTSGRIRRGPAPRNLVVPPYEFLTDDSVRIG
jgi:ubiquinol-cytochrome c reductase iron-sulfur subunit